MLVVDVNVKQFNKVSELGEYCLVPLEEVKMDILDEVLEQVYTEVPALKDKPYTFVFEKKWEKLPKKIHTYFSSKSYGFGIATRVKTTTKVARYSTYMLYVIFKDGDFVQDEPIFVSYTYD